MISYNTTEKNNRLHLQGVSSQYESYKNCCHGPLPGNKYEMMPLAKP